jgi:GrpB-like predicted nucleotidyltransferase (UPF0157 family)
MRSEPIEPSVYRALMETMQHLIEIRDYDPHWGKAFDELRAKLSAALGSLAVEIEHVGSTAVPGLPAKPIIDIDVVVESEAAFAAVREKLALAGYVYEGDLGISGRHAFEATDPAPAHHLYVCARDNAELRRHLAFRDYLRAHPDAAGEYGAMKYRAAAEAGADRAAYGAAKREFIEGILATLSDA